MAHILFNGNLIKRNENFLGVGNRALQYGDGLFESIRFTSGYIPFLNEHLQRIKNTCSLLKMRVHPHLISEEILVRIQQLLQVNSITKEAKIKIILFRNDGGLYAPENDETSYIIEATAYNDNGYELSSKGLKVDIYSEIRKPFNFLSGIKSCNSMIYVQAGIFKTQNQLDECIILNDRYNVCEFISSNLFIVINGVVYTPALSEACTEGVMRKQVIDLARQNRFNVYEVELKPNDLLRADEIFLSNAVKGLQWVAAYKNKRYFNKVSKTITDALNQLVTERLSHPEQVSE